MINVVIVDDEPKAIQSFAWELTNFSIDINIMASFSNPEHALGYLELHKPDCLFLDIQMPTMDGFQFLERLSNRDFAVVITTAYDEYAIKALKHEAIDYLLKPIDPDDLKETVKKIKKYNSRFETASKLEHILEDLRKTQYVKKVSLSSDGKLIFLKIDEIIFVESDGNYCTIYMDGNHKKVITKKLKEVYSILPDHLFFRIHNSFIINLNKIKEYIKTDGYVVMESNHKIPVARQRKAGFLEKF